MNEPRHLHEVDADERGVLLAENKRLAERCEQLEAALRGMVDYTAGEHLICPACLYRLDGEYHMADCPIHNAKALLGKDGQG